MLVENLPVPLDRRVWQECQALERAGYDVAVVCPRGADRNGEPFVRTGSVEIHRFPPRPSSGGARGYLVEYAWALWQMWRIARRLAAKRRFDVVHACNPPDLLFLPALSLRRRGARFVFDQHDLVPELYLSRFGRGRDLVYRITRLLERLAYRLADVVLATNESYREIAVARGGKDPGRVFVVRNGPDLTQFRPGEPESGLRRGKAHLLAYLGVMGPQDGVDHALRALALLQRRRHDWHAVFIGDGDVLPELRRLAGELGLHEDVEFAGWRGDDDLRRILSTSDVCLAPEPRSPLNDVSTMTKVAEYMAMRRPVVAYDLVETRRTAGDAALYAHDEEGLAACIDELLDDPARRQAMGALGRNRVETMLAWEHSERVLLQAYEAAVAAPRR